MVGIPGSGKSLFAEKFCSTFRTPRVSYDTIMELADQNGILADKYASHLLIELFKTRHTVVFDGPAGSPSQRAELKKFATAAGYKPLFIWVQTDEATSKARYAKMSKKSGRHTTAAQYDAMAREFTAPTTKEQPTVVISGKHTYATQAKAVLKHLTSNRQITRPEKPAARPAVQGHKRNISIG